MLSDKQLAANRENSQKSTGPRTEEGKRRSSLNATRHGLTGQVLVIPEENLAAFNKFTTEQSAALNPGDANELQLAQSWAVLEYRVNRAQAIEENIFTLGIINDNAGNLNLDHPEAHNAMCDARTFLREGSTLEKISLYTGRLVRQAAAVLKDLKRMQAERHQREEKEMKEAVAAYNAHQANGALFEPGPNGFVLPIEKIAAQAHREKLQNSYFVAKMVKDAA